MTREDYKPEEWDYTLGDGEDYTLSSKVDDIVDAIFDDFESRNCRNCEYYDSHSKVCYNSFLCEENSCNYICTGDDFGCLHFQRKFND